MFSKIGIVLVLAMYVLSGVNKFLDFDGTVNITSQKFPIKFPKWFFQLTIVGVVLLLTFGSSLLIYNEFTDKLADYAKVTTVLMIIFTILATMMFHFPPVGKDKYHFQKNVSIIGAFFLILGKLGGINLGTIKSILGIVA